MKNRFIAMMSLLLAIGSGAASAHSGDHGTSLLSYVGHAFTSVGHLGAVPALALLAWLVLSVLRKRGQQRQAVPVAVKRPQR